VARRVGQEVLHDALHLRCVDRDHDQLGLNANRPRAEDVRVLHGPPNQRRHVGRLAHDDVAIFAVGVLEDGHSVDLGCCGQPPQHFPGPPGPGASDQETLGGKDDGLEDASPGVELLFGPLPGRDVSADAQDADHLPVVHERGHGELAVQVFAGARSDAQLEGWEFARR